MFCSNCGKEIGDKQNFCGKCGAPTNAQTKRSTDGMAAEQTSTVKPKRKRAKGKIAIICILSVCIISMFVACVPFLLNTPRSITKKLVSTQWYSHPQSLVMVNSGERFDAAYSLSFSSDGTVVEKTYACYGSEGDYYKVEILNEETLDWEIRKDRTLVIGEREYAFNFGKDQFRDNSWFFDGENLNIGRTYYPEDEWGYSE